MDNFNTQKQLNEMRRQEAMRHAETQRRKQESTDTTATRSSLHGPVLARLGGALSAAGDSLQRRYGELEKPTSTNNVYGFESA